MAERGSTKGGRRRGRAPAIAVLLVDDHPLWREMLTKVLSRRDDIEVVAEAGDGEEALRLVDQHEPAVVVMDIDLPGINGIETTARVREAAPDLKVLVLSASDEREVVLDAIRAGASGYVVKTAGAGEVADALVRVHSGELVLPPQFAQVVLDAIRSSGKADATTGVEALTDAERDVLELMAAGRSNQAITEQLHVSIKTVEARVTSIYTKLQLQPAADDHRRVLAVLEYLDHVGRTPRGGGSSPTTR